MTVQRARFDILVVGGGPAGMAAATAAAASKLRVGLVDLYAEPGGQYAMAASPAFPELSRSAAVTGGRASARRLVESGVTHIGRAEVFAVEPGFRIGVHRGGQALDIEARALIVAAGAHEIVYPFPGWTLPGVITAGAAQRLLKASGVAPGRSMVLAGNGPFLYAVAQSFALADQRLRALVDAGSASLGAALALLPHPGRWGEALRLWRDASGTTDELTRGHAVIEAIGKERIEAVRIAPLVGGRLDHTRARIIADIDALCIGHGFAPVIDITAALGAEHAYAPALGGWHCLSEPATGATSVAGLFAAGETTGLGGARPAALSGELAGMAAAAFLGEPERPADCARIALRVKHARAFAAALAGLWPLPDAVTKLANPDTLVCRCEDVPRSAIDAALADGASDLGQAKLWTRAGMGLCQGRFCGHALRRAVSDALGQSPEALGFNPPRFPLRPVPADVASAWAEGQNGR